VVLAEEGGGIQLVLKFRVAEEEVAVMLNP